MPKKQKVVYNAHNGIDIYAEIPPNKNDPDTSPDLATYYLGWSEDPAELVKELRAAAEFIEHHGVKNGRLIRFDVG